MQHRDDVETAVRRALHDHLLPGEVFQSWESYISFDMEALLHSKDVAPEELKAKLAYFSLFRKWKGYKKSAGLNPARKAAESWLDAERGCARTNERLLKECAENKYSIEPKQIAKAQHIISTILGRLDWESISRLCRFGSGATFDKKRGTDHSQKSRRPSVTMSAIPYVCKVLAGDPYFGLAVGGFKNLKIVSANRLVLVPKNSRTHRTICADPTLNGYVQQGFGRTIRARLLMFGIDLNDQTVNQDLACVARFLGLATLDLASASDTLCIEICRILLPHEWFEVLSALRCPTSQIGKTGRRFMLSKFASMGNAYTFELETLIFYALCRAVCGDDDIVSVYGDDIIVPNPHCTEVIKTLEWAGFRVNHEKSFSGDERYRESCGRHYFENMEVTPCYQKEVVGNKPQELVRFHNRLIRTGIRLGLTKAFEDAARVVRDYARLSLDKKRLPGVGPLVEYDEYFIKANYRWSHPYRDRVTVQSVTTRNFLTKRVGVRYNLVYYGRKLRQPGWLNSDPKGSCADITGHSFQCKKKAHWRSATLQPHEIVPDRDEGLFNT